MTTTRISIERLATGTRIEVPGFGDAEIYQCEFDGYGYSVTYCTNDAAGWDALDSLYVEASGSVEFAGRGEPVLRAESEVTKDEHDAKFAALMAATASDVANANRQCAEMRGDAPALQAAE